MKIKTAQDAAEAYKSFDDWRYADREAAWKWMFEQGQMAAREACAKVCDDEAAYRLSREAFPLPGDTDPSIQGHKAATAQMLALAMRANAI